MMYPDLPFEIGLVVKDAVVVAEREDGLFGLSYKFFDVLQQFAETLPNFR
jgi:hypothetical protein